MSRSLSLGHIASGCRPEQDDLRRGGDRQNPPYRLLEGGLFERHTSQDSAMSRARVESTWIRPFTLSSRRGGAWFDWGGGDSFGYIRVWGRAGRQGRPGVEMSLRKGGEMETASATSGFGVGRAAGTARPGRWKA
jgi:hypothetical protein